jgi:hypothetical protein
MEDQFSSSRNQRRPNKYWSIASFHIEVSTAPIHQSSNRIWSHPLAQYRTAVLIQQPTTSSHPQSRQ